LLPLLREQFLALLRSARCRRWLTRERSPAVFRDLQSDYVDHPVPGPHGFGRCDRETVTNQLRQHIDLELVCHHHHVFGAPARTLGKQFERAALLGIHGRVPLTWRRRSAPPWQGARSPATARPLRRREIAPAAWHAMRVQRRCSCHQCTPLEAGPVLGAKLPRSRCARNGADDPEETSQSPEPAYHKQSPCQEEQQRFWRPLIH